VGPELGLELGVGLELGPALGLGLGLVLLLLVLYQQVLSLCQLLISMEYYPPLCP
jgi:hypothetical protein